MCAHILLHTSVYMYMYIHTCYSILEDCSPKNHHARGVWNKMPWRTGPEVGELALRESEGGGASHVVNTIMIMRLVQPILILNSIS